MAPDRIERFTLAERLLHWSNAAAILFLGLTGVLIWQDLDDWRPAGINLISEGHFWLGGGTVVAGALLFLALRRARVTAAAQRFNPQQTLNLRAVQLVLAEMVATGTLLHFGKVWHLTKPLRATIKQIHLMSAAFVGILVAGHLVMVLLVPKNRGLLLGMWQGAITRATAERATPRWWQAWQKS
jgi:cytochrome b subunit of formate dehydrogenase